MAFNEDSRVKIPALLLLVITKNKRTNNINNLTRI